MPVHYVLTPHNVLKPRTLHVASRCKFTVINDSCAPNRRSIFKQNIHRATIGPFFQHGSRFSKIINEGSVCRYHEWSVSICYRLVEVARIFHTLNTYLAGG